jgi:hypothetical protein
MGEGLSLNVRRILDLSIEAPRKTYTSNDFAPLKMFTADSNINDAINFLRQRKIFIESKTIGARPKKGRPPKFFELSNNLKTFNELHEDFQKRNNIKAYLGSEYVNYVIEKRTFLRVIKEIKPYLKQSSYRKIASKSLLGQSSTVAEYNELGKTLKREISKVNNLELSLMASDPMFKLIGSIRILSSFDPIEAIRIYRKTLHMNTLESLKELASKGIITEGLHSFMAFDTYLSPLTSFPANDIRRLMLLPNPFSRIYEDVYLLDGEAFGLFSCRAAAIYNYFADILFELARDNLFNQNRLEIFTKQMIFNWNIASTRFDLICNELAPFYDECKSPGSYHIKTDGYKIKIIDLKSEQPILPMDVEKNILQYSSLPLIIKKTGKNKSQFKIMANPFDYLRPCITFKVLEWNSGYVPVDTIISDLNAKLNDNTRDNVERNLSGLEKTTTQIPSCGICAR